VVRYAGQSHGNATFEFEKRLGLVGIEVLIFWKVREWVSKDGIQGVKRGC
jgi:hypothetical protein